MKYSDLKDNRLNSSSSDKDLHAFFIVGIHGGTTRPKMTKKQSDVGQFNIQGWMRMVEKRLMQIAN